MKVKLNRDRLEGMHVFVGHLLTLNKPEDKAERLLHKLVDKIRIKMRNRLDQTNARAGYQITLTEEESLAFEIWVQQVQIPDRAFIYERNIAKQLCSEIDKMYG